MQLDLLPFGAAALTHFLYLERPEGMERMDAAGFVPTAPPHAPVEPGEVMPRTQDFLTVGHLYRAIEQGLRDLAGRLGERALFVGPPRAQATPETVPLARPHRGHRPGLRAAGHRDHHRAGRGRPG